MTAKIRILIAADIRLYREGLMLALGGEGPLNVVGGAADKEDALALVRDVRPDVVLIDQAMPESLETVRAIGALAPEVRIVALAVPDVDQQVIACAEAGVAGFVPREAGVADLVATIQSVARGELLCSPHIAATLWRRVTALAAGDRSGGEEAHLTAREAQILTLVEQGCSNKDIARQLGIEVATAKNHIHNILEKLRVRRRGQAAARMRSVTRRTLGHDEGSQSQRSR